MASNVDDILNTPNDGSMLMPNETPKKKRGRPRKTDTDVATPRKSARQAEKKQIPKKELFAGKVKGENGNLDSEDEWSFDEEDEDYLATMFKKLSNTAAVMTTENEIEDEDEEEEEEEDDDVEEEEEALFQDEREVGRDVYDFDQQSSVASSRPRGRVTRQWPGQTVSKQSRPENASWSANVYSHVASLLDNREDLELYTRFLKCSHVNRAHDLLLADLCRPFRAPDADRPSTSLRSLMGDGNGSATVVGLVREILSDRYDNAAHRIANFVVVVRQPICGLRFCIDFSAVLQSIDPRMVADAAFLVVEVDRNDVRRTAATDVDTLVVSDNFHTVICDQFLSSASLLRVVVGLDESKSLLGVFLLDVWNRAGVPINQPRQYSTTSPPSTVTDEAAPNQCTETTAMTTMEFCDAFFVRMGGKKDALHLVVKIESRFLVYNVVSEYNFAFKKHGIMPTKPIVLEGMFSTFPEVLGEEKSVLVVPDQLYRSLAKTLAKEVQSPSCKFKKCVLLDKRTRLPLALFFDTEVAMDLQVDGKIVDEQPLMILSPATVHCLKPTTKNVMLVSLNGILVGFEITAHKSVTKCYEVVSDNRAIMRPHLDRRQAVQTTYLSPEGSSTTVQLANLANENTFVSASLYDNVPYCKRQEHIEQFLNDVAYRIFELPLKVSLLDSVFRMRQQATHVCPETCTQCVFCGREFRAASLYDHEIRHLGLVKFKCHKHQMFFGDMKTYRGHREEFLDCDGASENETELETHKLLNISANITECPQCQKCYDYFPQSDLLNVHLDVCDGVSFNSRTPLDSKLDATATGECNICGLCGINYPKMDTLCSHMGTHLSCSVCRTRLGSVEEVSAHIRDHVLRKDAVSGRGMRKIFTCDICQDFYGTKINYYYHQWTEHGVVHPPIKGEESAANTDPGKRRWKRSDELSYNATGAKKFACKYCGAEVKVSGRTYVKHLDTKHGLTVDADSVCRICAEVCETTERLSEHLRAAHLKGGQYVNAGVQSIFSCDKCTFFGHFVGVVNHSTAVHCESTPCLYECPHCTERMPERRLWRMHLERHEDSQVYNCNECFLHFKSEPARAAHLQTFHGVLVGDQPKMSLEQGPQTDQLPFECTVCRERFLFDNQLVAHRETHGALTQCDICQKTCKTSKAYELHRMKHFRTRIFQCTECQATFRSKLAMRRHIRVDHLNLEPERYECQICGKIVTQISMHMLIHKNARYQCEFCDKRFTKSAYYNEHVRIHKGEKPYQCHICQRKFNKKSNLNVHISFHEKHRDDYGNYLEIKPRGRGHPDYDPEKTLARKTAMIRYDAVSGPDEPGLCVHDDVGFKMQNVYANSKSCDTGDLEYYVQLLQQARNDEPEAKRHKC